MKNFNTQIVEVVVPGIAGGNTQRRIQIPDQSYLRDVFTFSLETYTSGDVTKSPLGNDVVDVDVLKNAYLTLYVNDPDDVRGKGEYIQGLPLVNLHTLQNADSDPFEWNPFELVGQTISWDKCYITLGAGIGNTQNVSFLFNVGFRFNPTALAS